MLLSIILCSGGTINSNTVSCLLDTMTQTNFDKYVQLFTGGYKPFSLNMAVEQAQKHGATHLMSIDCDQIFPPDGITRLLSMDKDIVGANYNERRFPLTSTLKMADESGNLIVSEVTQTEPFKCVGLGLGFLLIKMSVFDKLKKPYFDILFRGEDNQDFVTEDIYFCEKALKAGLEIWCHPGIKIGHEGQFLY